jgi:nicotinamide-nucleotide amidase
VTATDPPAEHTSAEPAAPEPPAIAPAPAGADDATRLAHEVLASLVARGSTVAVAESLTGGLVCAVLTRVAGSSAALRGGVVVYATDLKASLLGVDKTLLAQRGPVDPDVAAQMAAGVRGRLNATYGVATTGVAGPDRQGGQAVGTVHVAVRGPRGGTVRSYAFDGDRAAIRRQSVEAALALLAADLAEDAGDTPAGEPAGREASGDGERWQQAWSRAAAHSTVRPGTVE